MLRLSIYRCVQSAPALRPGVAALAVLLAASVVPSLAAADVIVDNTAGSGPHLNVMNQTSAGTHHTGTVNDTPAVSPPRTMSIFTGTPSIADQNKITPDSGNTLGSITITPDNFAGFEMLSINLDITDNTNGNFELEVLIDTLDSNGDPLSYSVDETGAGSQRIRIEATGGEIITSVTLNPLGDSRLEQISQVRIDRPSDSVTGGGAGGGGSVTHSPEPSSLALWGLGLAVVALGARGRRRRRPLA